MSNRTQIFIVTFILVLLFGAWYIADQIGFFRGVNPDNITVCRLDSTIIGVELNDPEYMIGRFSVSKKDDGIVHVKIGLARTDEENNKFTIEIDTLKDRQIEIHGKIYQIGDIRNCKD